jgi:two-component SAPR family response regulator
MDTTPDNTAETTEITADVCIRALGEFSFASSIKASIPEHPRTSKPMELLMALVAAGPKGLAPAMLCEVLWPNSEGDSAYRALITTVFRLRRRLGCQAAVHMAGGNVSISSSACRVDAWEFEQALQAATSVEQIQAALKRYTGPLFGDTDSPLVLVTRDRLRTQFARAVQQLGAQCERAGLQTGAAAIYQRALAVDDEPVELHRALIKVLAAQGHTIAAREAYQRCRASLLRRYGCVLSPAMDLELARCLAPPSTGQRQESAEHSHRQPETWPTDVAIGAA